MSESESQTCMHAEADDGADEDTEESDHRQRHRDSEWRERVKVGSAIHASDCTDCSDRETKERLHHKRRVLCGQGSRQQS